MRGCSIRYVSHCFVLYISVYLFTQLFFSEDQNETVNSDQVSLQLTSLSVLPLVQTNSLSQCKIQLPSKLPKSLSTLKC